MPDLFSLRKLAGTCAVSRHVSGRARLAVAPGRASERMCRTQLAIWQGQQLRLTLSPGRGWLGGALFQLPPPWQQPRQ